MSENPRPESPGRVPAGRVYRELQVCSFYALSCGGFYIATEAMTGLVSISHPEALVYVQKPN